jgi:hypothetical protein
VSWVVVTQASFNAWVATTDPDRDQDLRIAVLSWVIALVDGPPPRAILDPFSGYWYAEVADTAVWIKYIVLPDLVEPAIVIREYL